MSRYIDADELIEFFDGYPDHIEFDVEDIKSIINEQDAADVRENVRAHWIDMKPTGDSRFMCSRCKGKEKAPTIMGEPIVWDYCPNCGAQMVRGEK